MIKTLDAEVGKTLLSQLSQADVQIPSACHTGVCGACMCTIESGEEGVIKNFR